MIRKTFHWGHAHAKNLWSDSLYRNSFWLMAGQMTSSVIGVLFWIIAARFYSPKDIGLTTTYLSAVNFVTGLGMLGINMTLLKYLPVSSQKAKKINSAFTIVIFTSLIFGSIFMAGLPVWSKSLVFMTSTPPILFLSILFFPINTLNLLTDSVFTSLRNAQWVFVSNLSQSIIKLLILVPAALFGVWGLLASNFLAVSGALAICLLLIRSAYNIHYKFEIDKSIIQQVKKFALGSYMLSLIGSLPTMLLPILITNLLSPSQTAYFYIPNIMVSIIAIIPIMVSRSYFAESSQDDERKISLKGPISLTYAILLPIIAILILFGREILSIFGNNYAKNGYEFFCLMLISIAISAVAYFINARLMVEKKLKILISISIVGSSIYLVSILYFSKFGLIGIGFAGIITYTVATALSLAAFHQKNFLQLLHANSGK